MEKRQRTMVIVSVILLVILSILLTGEGVYLWTANQNRSEVDALTRRLTKLTAERNTAAAAPDEAAVPVDPYEGWLTYDNTTVGYTLRYPPDWSYEETKDTDIGEADFVTFHSKDEKYAFSFGLRPAGSDTIISGRTGLGQGEPEAVGTVRVLGESVGKTYHVSDERAVVIFYGAGTAAKFKVAGYEISAELGAPGLDYEDTELKHTPEEIIADKIIMSLKIK